MDTNDDQAENVGRERARLGTGRHCVIVRALTAALRLPLLPKTARHGQALSALLLVLVAMVFSAQETRAAVRPSVGDGGAGAHIARRPMVDPVMPTLPACPTPATGAASPHANCVVTATVESGSLPALASSAPAAPSGPHVAPILLLLVVLFVALLAGDRGSRRLWRSRHAGG